MNDKNTNHEDETGVITKSRTKVKRPPMYKVVMLNDDYTPMDFVVHILQIIFKKTGRDATKIMLSVHQKGVGICGIYSFEIAETKAAQVMAFAKANEHPLRCEIEKE
jgi:ATP-dependent Clp protease adaptor protein ClpS